MTPTTPTPWRLCLRRYVGVQPDHRGRCPACKNPVTDGYHDAYTPPKPGEPVPRGPFWCA